MKQVALGLDNGGTVIKAALFDLEGQEIAVASRKTPTQSPRPGYNEREMGRVWDTNCECIREVLDKSGIEPSSIIGIAVCGHGKGLYLWGKDGKPAYNGISSADNRAWRITDTWYENGTAQALYSDICQKLLPCQQASLLAWMKINDQAVYENIQWVFSVKDYIRFCLTGEAYSEATDISGSGLMNLRTVSFDKELLDSLGIGEMYDCLPPIRYSYDLCGRVTSEAAQKTGLLAGTPVAGGMFDIDACAVAMAVTKPEQLCMITGTWSINEFISPRPITSTQISMNSLYAIPGYYLLEECSATSAGNLEWVIQNCIGELGDLKGSSLYSALGDMVKSVDPAYCDVYYLPFLYGTNAHELAKACFIGLSNYHTKAHLLRAVYEGVAYSHKTHLNRLLSVREKPETIRMGGGAANSPFWVQIFADVLGYPIETVVGVTELGALGCAMAAAVATGVYSGYEEAARKMIRINQPIFPDIEKSQLYEKKYEKYITVVHALDGVWDKFTV